MRITKTRLDRIHKAIKQVKEKENASFRIEELTDKQKKTFKKMLGEFTKMLKAGTTLTNEEIIKTLMKKYPL